MSYNTDDVKDNKLSKWFEETLNQFEEELRIIESILEKRLEALEKSDANVEPEVDTEEPPKTGSPLSQATGRIISSLKRCIRVEEFILKENTELKKQLKEQQFLFDEIEMERDVLLQQVHSYLETNSSLRVRLEEQRCQTGTFHSQVHADLESKIKTLEKDKEKLTEVNLQKEREIRKMNLLLEQTSKCLKDWEMEMLNKRNEGNNLKEDLQKALEDKMNLEQKYSNVKKRLEGFTRGRNLGRSRRLKLRRSLSMGDVGHDVFFLEKNILLEPQRNSRIDKPFKGPDDADSLPTPDRSRFWPRKTSQTATRSPPVHTQLNVLRRDLLNVTKKLDALKRQLVSSGVIVQESTDYRRLKRKAKPLEEEDGGIVEEQKSEFKNLKNILQDAKNLNAKLENLREEKQKIIEMSKKCERGEHKSGDIENAVTKLKKAVSECEEQLDGSVITKEEALAGLVSPFFSCILSNLRCLQERRTRTCKGFDEETDTNSLMHDRSNESTEASSSGEDGGGDNPLKKQNSTDGLGYNELKIQIARLKFKIDHLEKV